LLKADPKEVISGHYDRLMVFQLRGAIVPDETYLGAARTMHGAARRAVNAELESLLEDRRAAWIAALDAIRR
jgi:hypothetical protein